MQQRLPKNSQDLVSRSFKNHIILKVIDKSCKQYESRMNTMRFSTTEIFVEVISMIDDIREESIDYDFGNAFDNLFCRLREYDSSENNDDAKMATSVSITWVAYLLFLCYDKKDYYDHWAHRLTGALDHMILIIVRSSKILIQNFLNISTKKSKPIYWAI